MVIFIMLRIVLIALFLSFSVPALAKEGEPAPKDPGGFYRFMHSLAPETAISIWGNNRPPLEKLLKKRGFEMGQPVYLRIFKDEGVIELWMQRDTRFDLFEVYPICKNSGVLGPKLKEGDGQAPEGFYEVSKKQLNPNSKYHLAINMGYPNAFDKSNGRTGGNLMIHGSCVSIGCYALTDNNVEEVYSLVEGALSNGQESVPIHAFPFRMTQDALIKHKDSKWIDFWMIELLPAYNVFDITGIPPKMMVRDKMYEFMTGYDETTLPKQCEPIKAWQ